MEAPRLPISSAAAQILSRGVIFLKCLLVGKGNLSGNGCLAVLSVTHKAPDFGVVAAGFAAHWYFFIWKNACLKTWLKLSLKHLGSSWFSRKLLDASLKQRACDRILCSGSRSMQLGNESEMPQPSSCRNLQAQPVACCVTYCTRWLFLIFLSALSSKSWNTRRRGVKPV